MKSLLAILLSFIMMEAPALAIHGGYTLPSSASGTDVTGDFSGVMIETSDEDLVPGSPQFGGNSLGLFTVNIPTVGIGSGSFVLFAGGQNFVGTIQAVPSADSSNPGITGILNAQFNYTVTASGTTVSLVIEAEGPLNVTFAANSNSVGGQGEDLSGTAELDLTGAFTSQNGSPVVTEKIDYSVSGFQQD